MKIKVVITTNGYTLNDIPYELDNNINYQNAIINELQKISNLKKENIEANIFDEITGKESLMDFEPGKKVKVKYSVKSNKLDETLNKPIKNIKENYYKEDKRFNNKTQSDEQNITYDDTVDNETYQENTFKEKIKATIPPRKWLITICIVGIFGGIGLAFYRAPITHEINFNNGVLTLDQNNNILAAKLIEKEDDLITAYRDTKVVVPEQLKSYINSEYRNHNYNFTEDEIEHYSKEEYNVDIEKAKKDGDSIINFDQLDNNYKDYVKKYIDNPGDGGYIFTLSLPYKVPNKSTKGYKHEKEYKRYIVTKTITRDGKGHRKVILYKEYKKGYYPKYNENSGDINF